MVQSNGGATTMRIDRIIWDLDDDPDGNVQHFAANGVAVEEAEEVLFAADDVFASNSGPADRVWVDFDGQISRGGVRVRRAGTAVGLSVDGV
jgi:hypothetical protein